MAKQKPIIEGPPALCDFDTLMVWREAAAVKKIVDNMYRSGA
jgi:hypothetical protein